MKQVTRVELSVSRSADGDIPVVAVSGEVDVYSAPALKEGLAELMQTGASSVVVDLSDVGFLDSTGLGALVEARAATTEAGGSLPLVCSHERILKLFTITGLDGVFSIHPTVDASNGVRLRLTAPGRAARDSATRRHPGAAWITRVGLHSAGQRPAPCCGRGALSCHPVTRQPSAAG